MVGEDEAGPSYVTDSESGAEFPLTPPLADRMTYCAVPDLNTTNKDPSKPLSLIDPGHTITRMEYSGGTAAAPDEQVHHLDFSKWWMHDILLMSVAEDITETVLMRL